MLRNVRNFTHSCINLKYSCSVLYAHIKQISQVKWETQGNFGHSCGGGASGVAYVYELNNQ